MIQSVSDNSSKGKLLTGLLPDLRHVPDPTWVDTQRVPVPSHAQIPKPEVQVNTHTDIVKKPPEG